MHATINDIWENVWESGNGNRSGYVGILKNVGMKKHANDVQMRQTDELQGMTSTK